MFNFTTQTVYNNIVQATDTQVKSGAVKNPNLIIASGKTPFLRIGNTRFDAENIESVQVKLPTPESLASVTFDMTDAIPSTGSTSARIVLYVGLSMNSQDSFYANDYVYKGKPLFIEFPVSSADTADVVAARVKKIADKYLLFTMGSEKLLSVTNVSTAAQNSDPAVGTVTFEGVNGYQQIKKAVLQIWDPEATTVDCCTKNGDYVDVKVGVPVVYTLDENGLADIGEDGAEQKLDETGLAIDLASNEIPIAPGLEAFCNYDWLIHNLRLPTLANTNFWSPSKSMGELPVVGQEYTQFIITLVKNRDGIAGGIVGQRATSVTTHVLYVAGKAALDGSTSTTAADKVYNALVKASPNGLHLATTGGAPTQIVWTNADSKLAAPFV